jgi:hypothetical protein
LIELFDDGTYLSLKLTHREHLMYQSERVLDASYLVHEIITLIARAIR